jgi:hypothetical protein
MTIIFLGGEIGSVTVSSGSVYESADAPGTRYDDDNARCAISILDQNHYARSVVHSGQAAMSYRWRGLYSNSAFSLAVVIFEACAGTAAAPTPQVRISEVEGGNLMTCTVQYLDSAAAWVSAGTFTMATGSLTRVEVFCDKTNGDIQVYLEGSLVFDASGLSLSHLSGFTHCLWRGCYQVAPAYISEIGGSTTPNEISHVKTVHATGNGAQTAWTGDYTLIDEVTFSDADGISSASGNDVETFTHSTDLEGYVILAVGLGVRGKKSATGPTGQQGVLRIGGSNYTSSTDTLGSGFTAFCPIWTTNPATAGAWDAAAAEALEFGVKSIT